MDKQPLPPGPAPASPPAATRRPWWRCGAGEYSDMTWLWIIIFMTSSSTTVSSGGENPVAWLVLGVSALLGLLLWGAMGHKRR